LEREQNTTEKQVIGERTKMSKARSIEIHRLLASVRSSSKEYRMLTRKTEIPIMTSQPSEASGGSSRPLNKELLPANKQAGK
jgi:hypothetical protein